MIQHYTLEKSQQGLKSIEINRVVITKSCIRIIVASVILWKHDTVLASHKKNKGKPDRNCFNRRKPHGT